MAFPVALEDGQILLPCLCQGSKCSAKSQPSPASHSSSWASASLSVKWGYRFLGGQAR